jgi:hypothetical protein
LEARKYPEVFRQAEIDLGGRPHLIDLVRSFLVGHPAKTSETYGLLARWPFPVYLTTNFDDAIRQHLDGLGIHYATLRNGQTDASQVRADSSHLIFKVHGDLDDPNTVVLTSSDYSQMRVGPEREYLRQKLVAIFSMCDVFVIGHSFADPDLQLIIETAKLSASPSKPIYMSVANLSQGEVRELNEQYNIHVIPYRDTDHSHAQLKRVLRAADHFICSRSPTTISAPEVDDATVEAATSLLLYRQTQAAVGDDVARDLFSPLLLRTMRLANRPMTADMLATVQPLALVASRTNCIAQISLAIEHIHDLGQLQEVSDGLYVLTEEGQKQADFLAVARITEKEQALGQFALDLRRQYPALTATQELESRDALHEVLVSWFNVKWKRRWAG